MNFDRSQASVYLTLSVIYSLLGIPANCISLAFFVRVDKSENISRYIFILLNSTDLFTSLCFIYQGISYVVLLVGGEFLDSTGYCSVMLAVIPTAQQLSILITAVLCVVRTISVVRPIYKIRKRVTFGIILVLFILIVVRTIKLFQDDSVRVSYRQEVLRCCWIDVTTGDLADFASTSVAIILLILTPSILGCLVTIFWLHKPSRDFPMSQTKRHATVTVLILTSICLLSSSTFVVERIVRMRGGSVSPWAENIALLFAYSFTCVANPAVYFIRLSRLQRFVRTLLCRGTFKNIDPSGDISFSAKNADVALGKGGGDESYHPSFGRNAGESGVHHVDIVSLTDRNSSQPVSIKTLPASVSHV